MKYAIVESGGKQYKAVEGQTIEVDLMPLEVGSKVSLEDVLLISDEGNFMIGTPKVDGAKVEAVVVAQIKAPKVTVFKYKPRQRYRVKTGHRQKYTRLEIDEIVAKGISKKAAKEEKPATEEKKAAPKTKSAAKPKTKTKTKTAAKTKTKTKTAAKTKTKTAAKTKTKTAAKTKTKTAAKKKETKKSDE